MLAGNATLIFHNPKTGGRRQYHIVENKECTKHHVKVVIAPGTEMEHETYIGTIAGNRFYGLSTDGKSEVDKFYTLYQTLLNNKLNPEMEIMHVGKCCACGRQLTDPESIKLGIGPHCGGRS